MPLLSQLDSYARSCDATVLEAGPDGIRLDRTVFYPAGGGQPGDTGLLRLEDGRTIPITDAAKDGADSVLHVVPAGTELPPPGSKVVAEIDWERRHRHMRMHTCLHLLCSVVHGGVTGGAIGDGKGRLDFDLPDQALDKDALTERLNQLVAGDHAVTVRSISEDELDRNPELVRTMSVKPPRGSGQIRFIEIEGVDRQPCGGTHVRRTGEIGRVAVTKIENKGRHNRRINLALVD